MKTLFSTQHFHLGIDCFERPQSIQRGTYLQFDLSANSYVTVRVFGITGRRVRTVRLFDVPAGLQKIALDGRDDNGRRLPTGVYVYNVSAGNSVLTRKLVVIK